MTMMRYPFRKLFFATSTTTSALLLLLILLASMAPLPTNAMNKAELVDAIAKDANLSKADSKRALEGFIEATTQALKKGDRISLVGFGSFSISRRAARTGRNPQTGATIKIKAKKVAKFKAGKALADTVKRKTRQRQRQRQLIDNNCDDDGFCDVVFEGNITVEFKQVLKTAGMIGDSAKLVLDSVVKAGRTQGKIVAFDTPGVSIEYDKGDQGRESGISQSLVQAIQAQFTKTPRPLIIERFLVSLRNVVYGAINTGDEVDIVRFGVFGRSVLDDTTGETTPRMDFDIDGDLALEILGSLQTATLDELDAELTALKRQTNTFIRNLSSTLRDPDFYLVNFGCTTALITQTLIPEIGDEILTKMNQVLAEQVVLTQKLLEEYYKSGDSNGAAGTRVRKGMQDLKTLAQDIRKEVQAVKNSWRAAAPEGPQDCEGCYTGTSGPCNHNSMYDTTCRALGSDGTCPTGFHLCFP